MADRRMFSKKVVETDKFYTLSHSAQSLYLHLCVNSADDDGFIDNVRMVMMAGGYTPDDLSALIKAEYILQVSESVYVIRHWHLSNSIQKDRFKPTVYEEEKSMLCRPNNIWQYKEGEVRWVTAEELMDTQNRLDQDSTDKESKGKNNKKSKEEVKHKHGVYGHVLLTDKQFEDLANDFPFDYQRRINELDEYLELHKSKHYDNHNLVIRKWAKKDKPEQQTFAEISAGMEDGPTWDIDL